MFNKKWFLISLTLFLSLLFCSSAKAAPDFTSGLNVSSGNVGIGTTSPGSYKLNVVGDVKGNNFVGNLYNFDVRTNNPLPRDVVNAFTSWFSTGGTSYVPSGNIHSSGFTVAGLTEGTRRRWQMAGDSSTSVGDYDRWYLRSGIDSTWTLWKQIITDDGTASGRVKVGSLGVGGNATTTNDIFSIANNGLHSPVTSTNTGHNYTQTYFSSDKYALANYGLVESLINSNVPSIISSSSLWGGTTSGNIWSLNSGNVGIGTTSPALKLDVLGRVVIGNKISSRSSYGNTLNLVNENATDTSLFLWQNGVSSGHIGFPASSNTLRIVNSTSDGSLNNAAAIVLTSTGYVGIGSTSPAYKLSVVGPGIMLDGNTGNANLIINDIANRNSTIRFNSAGVTQWSIGRGDSDELPASSFFIGTGSTGGTNSKLVIDSSGNVGIGTSTPAASLHVFGRPALRWGYSSTYSTWYGQVGSYGYADGQDSLGGLQFLSQRDSGSTNYGFYTFSTQIGTANPVPRLVINYNGNIAIGATSTNDILSLASGGLSAPAGSVNTGHNYTSTYLSADKYALANYGLVESLVNTSNYWKLSGSNLYSSTTSWNVGIGTTAPAAKLQINPQTGVEGLRVISSDSPPLIIRNPLNTIDFFRINQYGDAFINGSISLLNQNYDMFTSAISTVNGDMTLNLDPDGEFGVMVGSFINDINSYLTVKGNVGIGTTNPQSNLDIFGPSGVGSTTLLRLVKDGGYGVTEFRQFYGSVSNYGLDINSGQFVINKGSGNVGVGTTNPGTKLDVNGSINLTSSGKLGFGGVNTNWMDFTSNYFRLLMGGSGAAPLKVGGLVVSGDYGATAPTTGAYIQGNLGVGVSNPAQKLTISGTSLSGNTSQTNISAFTGNGLRINGSIGNSSQDAITYQSGSAGAGAAIAFGRDGSYGTFISMYTNPTSSGSQGSIVERLRVTQNGNVGIGLINPSQKLTILGGDLEYQPTIGLYAATASGNTATRNWAFLANYVTYGDFGIMQSNAQDGNPVSVGTTRLYIRNDGNIGVGVTNPEIKLAIGDSDTGLNWTGDGDLDVWSNYQNSMSFRDGNVSIGTTAPSTKLTIEGGDDSASTGLLEIRTTGGTSVKIGGNTNYSWIQSHNSKPLYINPLANNVVFNLNSGSVSIGTTSTTYKLTVGGDVGASAFNYTSDRSLKKNIKTISNPVDKIMNLRGVSFNWKDNGEPSIGLIAQEVEKVFPELVTGDSLKSVQYGNLVAPLIEAVKEQQREIELLNKRIEALEAKR